MKLHARAATMLSFALGAVPVPLAAPSAPPVPPPVIGGWTAQDPGSGPVVDAAEVAVIYLSEQYARQYVVEYITGAQSQVVAGTNYRLQMRIAQLHDHELGGRKDCEATVWQPLGGAAEEVISFTCQDVPADTAETPPAKVHV